MLAINNLFRELSGVRMQYQQDVNNSFSKYETEFEKIIQAILTVLKTMKIILGRMQHSQIFII